MTQRSRFRANPVRVVPQRRKRVWARDAVEAVTPADQDIFTRDLLSDFRTAMGISVNLPGFTIGPIKIKISIRFDISVVNQPQTQAEGYMVGLIVDTIQGGPPDIFAEPNADWMWWSWYPLTPPDDVSTVSTTVPANTRLVSSIEIDCGSKRKLEEVGQTLFLVVQTTGEAEIGQITEFTSSLVFLP